MDKTEELVLEQKHFDRAWEARERARANLGRAHEAAAGNKRVVADIRRNAQEAQERMGHEDEPVALGRIDPLDGDVLYVGRHAISDDERTLLVIGWQAPAAAPFYAANIDDPHGLERKRQFKVELNQVLDFEDMVFAELKANVNELTSKFNQPVDDALLRDLEATRDGEMKDIVQTIHHSQYDLVSRPLEQLLVIQGGPGTGKSAVALHRVSWLLFNRRQDLQPGDILVIGPSRTFSAYIQKVLPSLGNDGVVHGDLTSLGPITSGARAEDDDLARLKGETRMARLIGRGLMRRIRVPDEDLTLGRDREAVVFTKSELEAQINEVKKRARSYRQGRDALRQWVTNIATDRLNDQRGRLARAALSVPTTAIDAFVDRMWPSFTAGSFLQLLLGSQQRLVEAAGDHFTASEVQRLYRSAAERLAAESWSYSDVALLDEVEAQLGGRPDKFKHVVVDEAQDLSPMQIRSVRRRSTNGSFTIVGDVAQSTGPWARDSWDDIVKGLTIEHAASVDELEFGYRVPRQHFELAVKLLPTAAPGVTPPTVIRDAPEAPDVQLVDADEVIDAAIVSAQRHAGNGCSVGIVCPTQLRDDVISELRARGVRFTDARQGSLGRSINIMTAEESKGLEFDAVVVVEPGLIIEGTTVGERRLYIALTRTTGFLSLVYSSAVPVLGLDAEIPQQTQVMLEPEQTFAEVDEEPVSLSEVARTDDSPVRVPVQRLGAADRFVTLMADDVAAQIREAIRPDLWSAVVEALAERLAGTDE